MNNDKQIYKNALNEFNATGDFHGNGFLLSNQTEQTIRELLEQAVINEDKKMTTEQDKMPREIWCKQNDSLDILAYYTDGERVRVHSKNKLCKYTRADQADKYKELAEKLVDTMKAIKDYCHVGTEGRYFIGILNTIDITLKQYEESKGE